MKNKITTVNSKTINSLLTRLIEAGSDAGILEKSDWNYAYNRMLALLGLDGADQPQYHDAVNHSEIADIVEQLVLASIQMGIIEDIFDQKEILAANLMNCMMSRPSEINRRFYDLWQVSPESATEWFYDLCEKVQYIQTRRVSKNICYKTDSEYGELDITINLSKPEKNPADIAAERHTVKTDYPLCLLCAENEGYEGRIGHPARANHRLISLPELADEQWYLQYSPYSYYKEHCIVLSSEHRPMKINRSTFVRMFAFLDRFPHYFIGSNADLPIVGGSILSHDHYQGGRYSFAMDKADKENSFLISNFPGVDAGIVKWPMSVIRLSGQDSVELTNCANAILNHWRGYSDLDVGIIARTGDEPHNTVTPIARKINEKFELDLVLRNNRCTDDHPMGLFHPHEDVHHIKKENIGLIEVMGLAVLPARLIEELDIVARRLTGQEVIVPMIHSQWAEELISKYGQIQSMVDALQIVRNETALKFKRVLEDAGVFKRDKFGRSAFARYIKDLLRNI